LTNICIFDIRYHHHYYGNHRRVLVTWKTWMCSHCITRTSRESNLPVSVYLLLTGCSLDQCCCSVGVGVY
jgi:hypothetical protein